MDAVGLHAWFPQSHVPGRGKVGTCEPALCVAKPSRPLSLGISVSVTGAEEQTDVALCKARNALLAVSSAFLSLLPNPRAALGGSLWKQLNRLRQIPDGEVGVKQYLQSLGTLHREAGVWETR